MKSILSSIFFSMLFAVPAIAQQYGSRYYLCEGTLNNQKLEFKIDIQSDSVQFLTAKGPVKAWLKETYTDRSAYPPIVKKSYVALDTPLSQDKHELVLTLVVSGSYDLSPPLSAPFYLITYRASSWGRDRLGQGPCKTVSHL